MDMSKYRGMFLSETNEHLKNMGQLLIALEKNPHDRECIDTLFRDAHSIKGMAASMGYVRTAELAHHLEDLLDGFRQSGSVPGGAVDRLLAGLDVLEGLLEDLNADLPERDITEFLAVAAPPQNAPQAEPPAQPVPAVVPLTPAPINDAPPETASMKIQIALAADAAAPAARALLILRQVKSLGQLLSSSPSEEELRSGAQFSGLSIQLITDRDPADLQPLLANFTDVAKVTCDRSPAAAVHPAPQTSRKDDAPRTVRVRTRLLDQFINLTGELLTSRYMLQAAADQEQWHEVRSGLDQLARLITDLHHHVLQVRMTPMESITGHLPRMVRDLAKKTGKQIDLRLEGVEVEMDRAILEELSDPLVHMVRNAIDHGIEKSGAIVIKAWREKDLVLIEVSDNGVGMDVSAIRAKAVESGLYSQTQLKSMPVRDVLQLVCHPGFSTATRVTETSGRGVGMDIVKSAVENLGGTLEFSSRPRQGTRILLKLPLSVAIIRILLVECGNQTLGIPITRVFRTLELEGNSIELSGRQNVTRFDGEIIPLLSLSKVLGIDAPPPADTIQVVVSEARGRKVGLVVDRLSGQREAFVKTLSFPIDLLVGVNGATILGDGRIIFIIDPQYLLASRLKAVVSKSREH